MTGPSPSSGSATPGPWHVEDRCIEGPDGNIALLNLARKDGVTAANGRLIAAAPKFRDFAEKVAVGPIPSEGATTPQAMLRWIWSLREDAALLLREAEGYV